MSSTSLYLERYSQGHLKGCNRAIPELRSNIFTKCTCEEILKKERIEELKKNVKPVKDREED